MDNEILKHLSKYLKSKPNIENILGRFKLGKQLGQGGTSLVREAVLEEKNIYAIKFLICNIKEKEPTEFLRFKQAYINLLSIKNTEVVLPQIHIDKLIINEKITLPYTIMQKADDTLKTFINKNKIYFELFEKIFKDLLYLLETIHSNNIIHRDLKPENIFLIKGKLILGDFDIAQFNDLNHIKLHETQKKERLANYLFSAPEQSDKKFDEIDNRADLYALGQILYWLITKKTLRGQSKIELTEYDKKYQKYEKIIEILIQDLPQNRFQNIEEIKNYLENLDKKSEEKSSKKDQIKRASLKAFDEIIEKYTYDKSSQSFKEINDLKTINEIMIDLSKSIEILKLWWSKGYSDSDIKEIKKFSSLFFWEKIKDKFTKNTKWVLDIIEIDIKSIWIYKYGAWGGSIIIIETNPMPSFGIFKEKYNHEEIAIFKNRYIDLNHYDSGWTEINEKKVKVKNAKRRIRYLHKDLFFISPSYGSIIGNKESMKIINQLYKNYRENEKLNEKTLLPLKKLERK